MSGGARRRSSGKKRKHSPNEAGGGGGVQPPPGEKIKTLMPQRKLSESLGSLESVVPDSAALQGSHQEEQQQGGATAGGEKKPCRGRPRMEVTAELPPKLTRKVWTMTNISSWHLRPDVF